MASVEPFDAMARIWDNNEWENDMSRNSRIARCTITAVCLVITATSALAAQGPGVAPGTATVFMQTTLAIIVYGSSALIVAAGLIGGFRRH